MKLVITFLILTCSLSAVGQGEFTFVFLNTNENRPDIHKAEEDSLQAGHRANIRRLAIEDKLLVAGPFNGGGGVFILKTTDPGEAEKWIMTDPAIAANRYRIEILPWTTRIGSACLAEEGSAFGKYTFVRYNTHITKFNVRESSQLFSAHDYHLKKVSSSHNVISEGFFSNQDGGTLVLDGDINRQLIMDDPSIVNGIIEAEFKEIWLVKGSFCEE